MHCSAVLQCSAISYILHNLNNTATLLTSEKLFPSRCAPRLVLRLARWGLMPRRALLPPARLCTPSTSTSHTLPPARLCTSLPSPWQSSHDCAVGGGCGADRVNIKSSSLQKLPSLTRRIYRIFAHAFFQHRETFDEFEVPHRPPHRPPSRVYRCSVCWCAGVFVGGAAAAVAYIALLRVRVPLPRALVSLAVQGRTHLCRRFHAYVLRYELMTADQCGCHAPLPRRPCP